MLRQILFCSAFISFSFVAATGHAQNVTGASNKTIFVFDASGSMWGQINGEAKISIAKSEFSKLFNELSEQSDVGLIAYGHNRKGDCNDIQTLVPVANMSTNRNALQSAVNGLSPKGKTPLSKAVRLAAESLRYTEEAATVVLVTDGIETCNADPCALAEELERSGVNFTAHVVGFGLSNDEGQQVACLAEKTGGLYLPADNADQLSDALIRTVEAQPQPVEETQPERLEKVAVISNLSLIEGGEPLDTTRPDGVKWSIEGPLDENGNGPTVLAPAGREGGLYHNLVKGKYRYSVNYKFGGYAEKIIETGAEEEQQEIIPINGAQIEAFADFQSAGGDKRVLKSIRWQLVNRDSNEKILGNGHAFDFYVPPGNYALSIQPPRGKYEELSPLEFNVSAGDVVPASLILPHSRVSITAIEASGEVNKSIRYAIHSIKDDGSLGEFHRYMPGSDPVFAMPGSYILVVELWDGTKRKVEQPIDIGFGENLNIEVQLP